MLEEDKDAFSFKVYCGDKKNCKWLDSKLTKMNINGLNMVFKMIKFTSKALLYHLYKKIDRYSP